MADEIRVLTGGNTGSDDFGWELFVEQAPASTGTVAEGTGSRVSGGKATWRAASHVLTDNGSEQVRLALHFKTPTGNNLVGSTLRDARVASRTGG